MESELPWDPTSKRRQEYIRALRLLSDEGNQLLLRLVEAADTAELAWLLGEIDSQIQGTPRHDIEPTVLNKILDDLRHKRSWVLGLIETKRVEQERSQRREQRWFNWAMVVLAAVAALAGALAGVPVVRSWFH